MDTNNFFNKFFMHGLFYYVSRPYIGNFYLLRLMNGLSVMIDNESLTVK